MTDRKTVLKVVTLFEALTASRVRKLKGDPCEWNPEEDREAHMGDVWHGDATLGVGTGKRNIHLCESCAALPRFSQLRKRVSLRRAAKDRT